ncbi:asparagine synthase (glutamine-hydrolyzing) [Legionella londiniensis]|uniref:asparagine synthase (glutamine-hydrolyzing) n=1 Tax=Legionella londiniensis TaxID=45068 RepID=A0A0W0VID0_9GAMM|nr:asparagine synthase (glutamine-hydrolyzing) [Legionella londiniensis]KTD19850.1 asparagine synthetase, glutamine-hydrolyzing [Legionella londiniensis]STX93540.1 asparagine synthetase, glutamine-hydrolyzing [Legionella londiniensis]
MCGIAGIYALGGEAYADLASLHRMAGAMSHRGPDGQGFFKAYKDEKPGEFIAAPHESLYTGKADLFLTHRRLSIIDLSDAALQPMCTDDRRYWITYNGEIYNFQALAKELRSQGVEFHTKSDTEVLLKSYQHWGIDALERLNGMFAFAIWDDKEKTLFCARDRIGIKPLYYTIQNNRFIFGSDIKTLIASGLYKPEINLEGLYHAMSYGVAPRPLTCFKDIYSLPQASWMLIKPNGEITHKAYWHIPVGTQDHSLSEQDAADLLEERLNASVKRMLVSDVSIGTFMSGGVDSTLITAMAAKAHPGIKAFTLGYENYAAGLDEIPQAQATAAMYLLEHIIQTIKVDSILNNIEDNIRFYEEPYYSLSPNYLISRLVSNHHVKVVLNGLGGDELFAGYRHSRWANRRFLMRAIAPFFKLLRNQKELFARVSELTMAKTADRYYNILFTIMSEHLKQKLFMSQRVEEFNTIEKLSMMYVGQGLKFTDNIEAMCYMDLIHYIGNHHVYRVDQFTMAFSLEGRFPFLDHEVIEAAFKIPSKYKIKNGQQKYILRKVAEKYIAPECLSMKKKGFSLPMGHWIKNDLSEYVTHQFASLAKRDLFHPQAIWDIWTMFKQGKIDSRYVWQLVAVEAWLQMFF